MVAPKVELPEAAALRVRSVPSMAFGTQREVSPRRRAVASGKAAEPSGVSCFARLDPLTTAPQRHGTPSPPCYDGASAFAVRAGLLGRGSFSRRNGRSMP